MELTLHSSAWEDTISTEIKKQNKTKQCKHLKGVKWCERRCNKDTNLFTYSSATLAGYYSGVFLFKNSTSFCLDVERKILKGNNNNGQCP